VTIDKITEMSRRVVSIRVDSSVAVTGGKSADSVQKLLTADAINAELSKVGLPNAKMMDSTGQAGSNDGGQTASTTPAPTAVGAGVDSNIIIAVVCGVVLLLPVPVFIYWIRKRRRPSPVHPMRPKEEKKFLKQVNKVIGEVLTEEERKTLLEAIRKHCQNNPNTDTNKFGVEVMDMVTGEYKKAVDGLNDYGKRNQCACHKGSLGPH
jgi:hypothetical protein